MIINMVLHRRSNRSTRPTKVRSSVLLLAATIVLLSLQGFDCSGLDVVAYRNQFDRIARGEGGLRPRMAGDDAFGQQAKPPVGPPATTAKTPSGFTDAVTVDGGAGHSVAVTADRKVQSAGSNDYGQLGNGTTTSTSAPVEVPGITDAVQAEAGWFHSVILKGDGTVHAMGDNFFGQMGDGGVLTHSPTPVQVPVGGPVVRIHVGQWDTSFAILEDGTVKAWGVNANGEIGDGTDVNRPSPTTIPGLTDVVKVACGGQHTLFLKEDGTVLATGSNTFGQLGLGIADPRVFIPTPIPGLSDIADIASGVDHSVAVTTDGRVFTWGRNLEGQLGVGSSPLESDIPIQVPGLSLAESATGGWNFTLIRSYDGTARSFGDNSVGQLGIGSLVNSAVPVEPLPASSRIGFLGAGHHFSIFHEMDGPIVTFDLVRSDVTPLMGQILPLPIEILPSSGPGLPARMDVFSPDGATLRGNEPYPASVGGPLSVRIKQHDTFLSRVVALPEPGGEIIIQLGTITLKNGDVNGDNSVGIPDFLQLRDAYGSTLGGPTWNPNADLNKDGSVNVADFFILRRFFGSAGE